MQIKHFINNQWLEYADYDNRRSLPHIIDGLKITQRKAIFAALKLPKGDKPVKVSQFASKAAADTAYHHGEVSMMSTVTGLAQDFPGSNNFPLFEKHGQFGSRLSAEASSPRYIHTKLHPNWDRFFKKEDQEIVESQYDDDMKIEPKYYVPVVPMVLLNGADGVGNGFRSSILNYSIESVVKAIKEVMKHGKVKSPVVPHINGFTGSIEKIDRQVTFRGVVQIVNSTKLKITELPPGYDNDKYKKLLNKLIEDKLIKEYFNHSNEDKWEWIIECPRSTTSLGVDVLTEKLGLIGKVSENFVGWGIDASAPMIFEGPEALIEYWFEERIKLYKKSIDHQIKQCEAELIRLDLRIRFIKWCLKNDFRKLSRAEFIANSVAGVKRLTAETAAELVSMPMYRITTDEVKKAEEAIEKQVDILDELESLTPIDLMDRNIKGL